MHELAHPHPTYKFPFKPSKISQIQHQSNSVLGFSNKNHQQREGRERQRTRERGAALSWPWRNRRSDDGQRRLAAGGGADQEAAEGPADDPRPRPPHADRQDLQRPPARRRPPPQKDHRPLAQALPPRQVRPHLLHHSLAQSSSPSVRRASANVVSIIMKYARGAVGSLIEFTNNGTDIDVSEKQKKFLDTILNIYFKTMTEDDDKEVVASAYMNTADIMQDCDYMVLQPYPCCSTGAGPCFCSKLQFFLLRVTR